MNRRAILPTALLLAALAAAVFGYTAGDPMVVWRKAAIVCLECIGVG